MDIYTIIFLALAVFIFLRLRNVLGQRTGNERPPYDRAARNVVQGAQDNNVVPMPGTVIDQAPLAPTADVVPPTDRWKGLAEPGTPLAQGLDAIAAQDSSFDPRHFISGARGAYEMIVLAFANGDRRALKDLLSAEVFDSFDSAIKEREKLERKTETRFVSIDKAELIECGSTGSVGATNRPLCVADGIGYPRQGRHDRRRQSGQGYRHYRCLDLRP